MFVVSSRVFLNETNGFSLRVRGDGHVATVRSRYWCQLGLDAKVLVGLPANITLSSTWIMFQGHYEYIFDFGPSERVLRSFKGPMSTETKTRKPTRNPCLSWERGWSQLSPKHTGCIGEQISDLNGNLRALKRQTEQEAHGPPLTNTRQ